MYQPSITPRRIAIGAALAVAALTALGSFYVVSEGHEAVVTRTGSIVSTEKPGLHFKAPMVDSVHKINMRTQTAQLEKADGGTADMQTVSVGMVVRFSIREGKAAHVYANYAQDGDMDNFVMTATAEAFKAVTANYTAPQLIQKRNEVSQRVQSSLQAKVNQYGLAIENVDMTDFGFDKQYMASVNAKVREDQNLETQRKVLERITVEQQQKVAVAKAEAEATQAHATAEAFKLTAIATAKAKALEVEGKALRENSNVAELRRIEVDMVRAQRWKGDVPSHMYGSAPIPFVNTGK